MGKVWGRRSCSTRAPHHNCPGQTLRVFIDIQAAGLRGQPLALRKQRQQQGNLQVSPSFPVVCARRANCGR